MNPETQITNLLYRYAEYVDSGDLNAAAALFAHARVRVGPGGEDTVDAATILGIWRSLVICYPDGTPRTKHVVTNPIIDIDGESASCRSYYTVLQQTDDFPLQVVVSGRHRDRFECVDGVWRFCYRDYTLIDFLGDTSHHLSRRIG
ncbi:MAG TPA: nuclear transport factor 2 family protein [Mycobacterium sp.]|nr:nuclear transport factor 2 family protein [Mycobacterium sp.]